MGKIQSGDLRQAEFGTGPLAEIMTRRECQSARGDQVVVNRLRTGGDGQPVGSRAERRMAARFLRKRAAGK